MDVLNSHFSELRSAKAAYAILDGLDNGEVRREAAGLVDLILAEELSLPSSFQLPPDAMAACRAALQAAHPDRKAMNYLLASFPGWIASLAANARTAFLEQIPVLAPAVHDLQDAGMRLIVEAASLDPTILAPVASYAMTTPEAIRVIAQFAHGAAKHGRVDLLERLAAACPAEKMEESRDAEHLPPAIGEMMRATEAWPQAAELAVALTERNISSTRGAAKELAGKLRKTAGGHHAAYLEDFRLLVEAIGIRVIGFSLGTLPGLYDRPGMEPARHFVSLACQAAQSYGTLAGQAFLERKTQASRDSLR